MIARLLPSALLLLGLAACAVPIGQSAEGGGRASTSQQENCRRRADQAFARANPGDAFRTDHYISGQRDTPFGGSVAADPTADLQARYVRADIYARCLRRVTAQPDVAAPASGQPASQATPPKP